MKATMIYTKAASMLSIAAMLFFSGCTKSIEPDFQRETDELSFSASVGKVLVADRTKASTVDSDMCRTFTLTSADGSISIPVTMVETDGLPEALTKGSLMNGPLDPDIAGDDAAIPFQDSLHTFVASAYLTDSLDPIFSPELDTAKWNGTNWRMDKTYYWPQATGLDVYAYANMPSSEYATITIDEANGKQVLDYTVPRNTKDQKDILMAVYSGTGNNKGEAELMFYHPLTAVQFSRANSLDITGITEIIMNGVNYGGTTTLSKDSPEMFDWIIPDKESTVSQDNGGKPFELHGKIDGDPFLLVPQESVGSRSVVLTVTLIYKDHEIPLNAVLSGVHWEPGKTYTYNIGFAGTLEVELDLEDGTDGNTKDAATIKNVGIKKCYVRAIVDNFVTDKDGYIKRTYLGNEGNAEGIGSFSVTSGTFGSETSKWNTNWIKGTDGFYYYTLPLLVGETTTPLFDSYLFSDLGLYEYCEMNISTQAIEWDEAKTYIKAYWGEDAPGLMIE